MAFKGLCVAVLQVAEGGGVEHGKEADERGLEPPFPPLVRSTAAAESN